jgi:hypothetical protein
MISNHWPEDSSPSYEFCRIRGFLGNSGICNFSPISRYPCMKVAELIAETQMMEQPGYVSLFQ